ncbi:MAG: GspH/FimT family protein [Mariprofundaceae bacterium]
MNCGFTLLEILVVLVIIAVAAAVVAPSVMSSMAPDGATEARRLAQALRLAADEAQLGGVPLRWLGWRDRWRFEQAGEAGQWRPLAEPPFAPHALPPGLVLLRANRTVEGLDSEPVTGGEKPPLAAILLPPDGAPEPGWIELGPDSPDSDAAKTVRVRIAPGPGGIRVEASEP